MRVSLPSVAIAAVLACLVAQPASAKKMPFQSPERLKSTCTSAGGEWFPPIRNGVYGCQFSDGAVTVCGGIGSNKRNCEIEAPAKIGTILHPIVRRGGLLADYKGPGSRESALTDMTADAGEPESIAAESDSDASE